MVINHIAFCRFTYILFDFVLLERWNNIQKTERELQWCQICEMSKRVFINGEERWICNGTQNCDGEALREMFDKNGSCPSYRPQPEQQFNRELNAIQEQWGTQACREVIENWKKIGTALKPSFEPIIVARKPFKGSCVDNVLKYGVGGINIDECRVENNGEKIMVATNFSNNKYSSQFDNEMYRFKQANNELKEQGRFPANTILTYDETDFDEVCGGFPNTKPAGNKNESNITAGNSIFGIGGIGKRNPKIPGDNGGSASRYFYCAKASKKDRDEGLNDFQNVSGANITGRKEGSAGLVMEGGKQNPFATGISDYDNTTYKANGRFPANTILTYDETDFDEVCGGFPNTKPAGNKIGKDINKNLDYNASSYKLSNNKCPKIPGDNGGSASRYFYCAKASAKDRNEGLDIEIEEYVLKENTPKEIKQLILNSLTS